MDPVRYLTNPSSGEMGIQLAEALQKKGAHVILVLGPTSLKPSSRVKCIPVSTALEMNSAVQKKRARADVFIATAAVGDFRFDKVTSKKIKKENKNKIKVTLIKNPDILKETGAWKKKGSRTSPLLIGFALETTDLKKATARKLKEKNLDLIIGNSPASFSSGLIKPYWLELGKAGRFLGPMTKKSLAQKISNWIGTHE